MIFEFLIYKYLLLLLEIVLLQSAIVVTLITFTSVALTVLTYLPLHETHVNNAQPCTWHFKVFDLVGLLNMIIFNGRCAAV